MPNDRTSRPGASAAVVVAAVLAAPGPARALEPESIPIERNETPIAIDGNLDDEAWGAATRIDTWYETNPGDNVPPKVRNVGYVTYDDSYFYAAFEFEDPQPDAIRAPLGDRDNVPGYTDYGGVILDTRNDGKTGLMLLSNPRGVQYDAVTDDVTGNEDASLDLFWESASRITDSGWVLELRVPFSSLRYARDDPQTWGVLLYRNYPREFRYQMFSSRLPRGGNCLVCYSKKLTGLEQLPRGGHVVVAPFVTAAKGAEPLDGPGSTLEGQPLARDVGLDVKWNPNADTTVDATLNPDFSQVESDVAQIGTNERFALFFPERRPFFLEGLELYATPIQAVYTRTVTAPRWGVRTTGKLGATAYTGFVVQDEGGGSVIIPSSASSTLAEQAFRSTVAVGRLRHDVGRSFVSLLATQRQVPGGGFNRVVGPDFQWRPTQHDTLTGQLLFSRSRTPQRPELAAEWDGRRLSSRAGRLRYQRRTRTYDLFGSYKDFGAEFRADAGFVPKAGFRQGFAELGYTFRPRSAAIRRLRTFLFGQHEEDHDGRLLNRYVSFGAGMSGRWNSFARLRYSSEELRAGEVVLPANEFHFHVEASPTRSLSQILFGGRAGRQVDFDNSRVGHGADVYASVTLRPGDHLQLQLNLNRRWLNVGPREDRRRLFTARVDRLRATYTFTARCFVRAIAQHVQTLRDPALYGDEVDVKSGSLTGSLLFAYKLNWQTVLFLGYGDRRAFDEAGRLQRAGRELFVKLGYAFQH